ncbi:hypothetical protein [Candidatus Contendibacter odensensis]|uniref:Uncharacterized protein n=1 Tax=Candidatus Contendobacter odensis Run_B_J11 TaxID=1400861 RepID=A0A7U7G8Z9_9GAMM|nr:hypothetical protein [Candidatus Contendobacter odensis]CDH43803.1 hypothetical protein BN874_1350001 [Candidatus Contendobacter odensis Run_B_J11]
MRVSPAAVGKACKSGRLSVIDGKWLDEKVAEIQWDANRQRLAPLPRMPPRTAIAPDDDEIDWDVEHTGIWITLIWNRAAVPASARNWLELATAAPADPRLLKRITALLGDIADCVNRMKNPEHEPADM